MDKTQKNKQQNTNTQQLQYSIDKNWKSDKNLIHRKRESYATDRTSESIEKFQHEYPEQ